MKLLEAKVDWQVGLDSPPHLVVVVDQFPPREEARWRRSQAAPIWWAEQEGLVRYRYWKEGSNNGGSYGDVEPITLVDGTKVQLLGAWSSRAGVVNSLPDTPEIVDVRLKEMEGRHPSLIHLEGITRELAMKAAEIAEVPLLEHYPFHDKERTWVPDPRFGPVTRCLVCMARAKPVGEELKCCCPTPTLELL